MLSKHLLALAGLPAVLAFDLTSLAGLDGRNVVNEANGLGSRENAPIPYSPVPLISSVSMDPVHFGIWGAERTKMSYGPYMAPSRADTNSSGMSSYENTMTLPCHDCYVTSLDIGLEYPNGTYANVNTSMYFHHGLMINANRADPLCTKLPYPAQRTFAAGNERIPIDMTNNGTRTVGYYIAPGDTFIFLVELMNMLDEPREGVVTIVWEFMPANRSEQLGGPCFEPVIPVWLDIDGPCGAYINGSDVAVPQDSSPVTLPMFGGPWSPYTIANSTETSYEVLMVVSHLHDGGLRLDVAKNDTVVCRATAHYGETAGYIEPMEEPMGSSMGGTHDMVVAHLSSIQRCWDLGTTDAEDLWKVTAYYNMTAHPGMEADDGSLFPVMGIAVLFVLEK